MIDPSIHPSTDTTLQGRVLQSSVQSIEPSPFKVFQQFKKLEHSIDQKYKSAIKEAENKKAAALIATGYYEVQDEVAAQGGYDIRREFKEQVKEFDEKENELADQIAELKSYLNGMVGTKRRPGPLKQAEDFLKNREKTNREDTYTLQDLFDDKNIVRDNNRPILEAAGLLDADLEKDNFLELLQAHKDNDPATYLYITQKKEFDKIQALLGKLTEQREENAARREALRAEASAKLGELREKVIQAAQHVYTGASKELDVLMQAHKDEVSELWGEARPKVWKETKDAVKLDFYRSLGDAQYCASTIAGACSDLFKGMKNALSVLRATIADGYEQRQKKEFAGEKKRDAFLQERAESLAEESNNATFPKQPETPEPAS